MPHLNEHHAAWIGRMLTDALGHKIGKIDDIYTDDDTGRPEWLAVSTGLMGPNTHFVPLRGATVSGGGVQVPFPKEQVKVAPRAAADGRLSRLEKGRLYAHYGYSHAEERNRLQRSLGFDAPVQNRPAETRVPSQALALLDTSGTEEWREPGRALALRDMSGTEEWREPGRALALRDAGGSAEWRDPSREVAPGDESRPADRRDMREPAERHDEAELLPPPRPSEGRGRWPDDEAIFGLSQQADRPTLAATGAPRWR